jgi:hypothetical protein
MHIAIVCMACDWRVVSVHSCMASAFVLHEYVHVASAACQQRKPTMLPTAWRILQADFEKVVEGNVRDQLDAGSWVVTASPWVI